MPKMLSEVLNELESRIKNLEDAFCEMYYDCYDEYDEYDDCCDCELCNVGYRFVELDDDCDDYYDCWYDSEAECGFTIELQFDDDDDDDNKFGRYPCRYCGMWSPYVCVGGE